MILSQYFPIKITSNNCRYYKNLGYDIPTKIDKQNHIRFHLGKTIIVKLSDIPRFNHFVKVLCKCDCCLKEFSIKIKSLSFEKQICKKCQSKKRKHNQLSREKIIRNHHNVSGSNNPRWKGGNPHCKDCGKEIYFGSLRCKSCFTKSITGEKSPNWIPNKNEYQKFRKLVDYFTRQHKKELFKNWNGIDFYTNKNILYLPKRDITIDHKISVKYGFDNKISAEEIGTKENLCICSRKTNSSKGAKNAVCYSQISS